MSWECERSERHQRGRSHQWIRADNELILVVSLCAGGGLVKGKWSEVLHECPSECPLPCLFLCIVVPLGAAVRLHDIFICGNRSDPTARWDSLCTLGFDLVFSNFVSEELPGEVCSQAVLLQPPTSQPTAPRHSSLQIYFRSHNPLQSQDTAFSFLFFFFFMFLLLTLIIAVLHLQHNLALRAYRPALLRLRDSLSKALQMLLMCTYPAEQACPQLSAILSASATVICQL